MPSAPLPALALAGALLWPGAASAQPTEAIDTPAGGVPLEEQLYNRLDMEPGHPARPRWRRRSVGNFLVASRPDGTVQRALEGRHQLQAEHLFDVRGVPTLTVRYDDDRPVQATVYLAEEAELDLGDWVQAEVPGASLWAPAAPDDGQGALGQGRWWVWSEAAAPVWSDGFRDEVLAGCRCDRVERRAAWVDGAPAVRLRLVDPDDEGHQWVLWAVPRGEKTWLAAAEVTATDPDTALAEARVVLATLRWAPPAPDEGDAPAP